MRATPSYIYLRAREPSPRWEAGTQADRHALLGRAAAEAVRGPLAAPAVRPSRLARDGLGDGAARGGQSPPLSMQPYLTQSAGLRLSPSASVSPNAEDPARAGNVRGPG